MSVIKKWMINNPATHLLPGEVAAKSAFNKIEGRPNWVASQ